MKKSIIAGMIFLVALGIVVGSKGFQLKIQKSDPSRSGEEVIQIGEKKIGQYGEIIVTHEKGVDILPPRKGSSSFSAYKAQRLAVLKQAISDKTERISAQVTFNEPLQPSDLENLQNLYAIEVIGIEGLKDGNLVGMRYSKLTQEKNAVDKVLSMVVEGNPAELMKLQQDDNVLVVDPNIEGFHARVQ